MTKHKIRFKLPNKFEILLFVLGFIFFGIFDYAQNQFIDTGDINVSTIIGIKAIALFWIFILLYHIVLFTAVIRALIKKTTSHIPDFIFGTIAIIGTYILIAGAIAGIYFGTNEPVPFLFNITQISAYHQFGVFPQVLAFMWFVLTD